MIVLPLSMPTVQQPVYLYGTPRYPACLEREENLDLYSEPPPKLDLFDDVESADQNEGRWQKRLFINTLKTKLKNECLSLSS